MRTFAGPTALALRGRINGTAPRLVLVAAAGGEAIGDKTPFIPKRTSPPAAAARLLSGAFCGRTLGDTPGLVAGAAGAVATTFGAARARAAIGQATGLPDPLLGLVEDGAAAAVAALATRPRRQG
jgi:uncharacterized membrane protein